MTQEYDTTIASRVFTILAFIICEFVTLAYSAFASTLIPVFVSRSENPPLSSGVALGLGITTGVCFFIAGQFLLYKLFREEEEENGEVN